MLPRLPMVVLVGLVVARLAQLTEAIIFQLVEDIGLASDQSASMFLHCHSVAPANWSVAIGPIVCAWVASSEH